MNIRAASVVVVLVACGGHSDQRATAPPAAQQTPGGQPSVQAKPHTPPASAQAKIDATRRKLAQYAFEAFPMWSAEHFEQDCPEKLADLDEYMFGNGPKDSNDAWGRPLKMMCGAVLPPGARGIAIVSRGEDGKEGTEDDLRSW